MCLHPTVSTAGFLSSPQMLLPKVKDMPFSPGTDLLPSQFQILPAMKETGFDPWVGKIQGRRKSPEEGNGNSLQYSSLENAMDRGVHSV